MAEISVNTVYFKEPGKINTERTLKIALNRVQELRLEQIVIASTGGNTALEAMEVFRDYNPIIVTH